MKKINAATFQEEANSYYSAVVIIDTSLSSGEVMVRHKLRDIGNQRQKKKQLHAPTDSNFVILK